MGPLRTTVFWQHLRALLLEQVRTPLTVVANLLMPALGFLTCALLVPDILGPRWGAASLAQFWVLGALSNGLFTTAMTVSHDRHTPWGRYLSTLPVSPLIRPAAIGATVLVMTAAAALVVLLVALPLLAAPPPAAGLLAGLGWLGPALLPFALLGLGLGRWLPLRAVPPVAQAVFLAAAFGGGLLLPVTLAHRVDAWLMPSTAAVEVVAAQLDAGTPARAALAALAVWAVVAALLAFAARTRSPSTH